MATIPGMMGDHHLETLLGNVGDQILDVDDHSWDDGMGDHTESWG